MGKIDRTLLNYALQLRDAPETSIEFGVYVATIEATLQTESHVIAEKQSTTEVGPTVKEPTEDKVKGVATKSAKRKT